MARRRSHRNAQLVRLLALVRDLARKEGCDLYELATRYQVSVRTIHRDLDALAEAGVPLVDEDDGRRKRWRIVHQDPRKQVAGLLDASHYLAVRAALGGVTGRSKAVTSALGDLAEKLERTLTAAERSHLAAFRDCFASRDTEAFSASAPDVLWPLMTAIAERRCCDIVYAPPNGNRSQYVVLPLKLFAHNGAAYVLVHHRRRDVVMTLALHRLRGLTVTKQAGTPPANFDGQRYVTSLFGVHGTGKMLSYRLRFNASVAPFVVERQWHPTQRLRRRADGGVDLAFTCQESFEVSAWVASWRANVTALGPACLRSELQELGEQSAKKYTDVRQSL